MSEAEGRVHHHLEPEDRARAEFYALLARLYAEAPDPALLEAIATAAPLAPPVRGELHGAGDDAKTIAGAWDSLRAASAVMEAEAAGDEFQALFVGVGKSAVSLYASHYLGPQSGRPLAEIRATLCRTRSRASIREQRVRGPSVGRARNHADARGRGRRAPPRVDRRTATILRAVSDDLGVRLLRRNIELFSCQLLPAGRIIHALFSGARTGLVRGRMNTPTSRGSIGGQDAHTLA